MRHISEPGYNEVSLTGHVAGVSVCPSSSCGAYVSLTLAVPRASGEADNVRCVAFDDDAVEIAEHVSVGDVVHVEGALRVKAATGAVCVSIGEWWIEDGDVPLGEDERESEIEAAKRELDRAEDAICGILPPEDMTTWESFAWSCAAFRGAEWKEHWDAEERIRADDDERLERIRCILDGIFNEQKTTNEIQKEKNDERTKDTGHNEARGGRAEGI
jgi:hypothetical protein